MAGHSRGGKTAFAVALRHAKAKLKLDIRVLVGIDPVAGCFKYCEKCPWIIFCRRGSFKLDMPVMVIGAGLGPEKGPLHFACAPEGVNHENFFCKRKDPRAHFVAKEYGHMDKLYDHPEGRLGKIASCMCKNGTGYKDCMRTTVGGLVVAFLRAH